MIVEDDGIGFNPAASAEKGLGIVNMRERMILAGGRLVIDLAPGAGTTVIARISANDTVLGFDAADHMEEVMCAVVSISASA